MDLKLWVCSSGMLHQGFVKISVAIQTAYNRRIASRHFWKQFSHRLDCTLQKPSTLNVRCFSDSKLFLSDQFFMCFYEIVIWYRLKYNRTRRTNYQPTFTNDTTTLTSKILTHISTLIWELGGGIEKVQKNNQIHLPEYITFY